MEIEYNYTEAPRRGYKGIYSSEQIFSDHLKGPVKDNLIDREEHNNLLEHFRRLNTDTGFNSSSELLADIQALEQEDIDVRDFRVGEAYAEVILEEKFSCRFYWNELRDARNRKGSKTGADIIGFIENDDSVLFLFGEVKTSSEINRPPQVMTKSTDGLEKQLCDLYCDRNKRNTLISYLKSKTTALDESHPFKVDLEKSIQNYYTSDNPKKYHIIGVLVRDVSPKEQDLSDSYHRIKETILAPSGLELLALYVPISKSDWLDVINGED